MSSLGSYEELQKFISLNKKFPSISKDDKKLCKWVQNTLVPELNEKYKTGESDWTDKEYDALVEECERRCGSTCSSLDSKRDDRKKVVIPVFAGSLAKVKTQEKLDLWKNKYHSKNYIITDKLDGLSGVLFRKSDKKGKRGTESTFVLSTRGDGSEGEDVSHFIPFLISPKVLSNLRQHEFKTTFNICIRGEMIMKKKVFEKNHSDEKNPRNTTAGIIHRKTLDEKDMKDVDFVPYYIQYFSSDQKTPNQNEMLTSLSEMGFLTPRYSEMTFDELTIENLTTLLLERKKTGQYEQDGVVIYPSKKSFCFPDKGDPEFSIAFKLSGETTETIVESVEWNVSKSGRYCPRIILKPFELSGVTISATTGYNAKYVVENKINTGAVVRMTRSGDTIPKIVEVITPSNIEIELPSDKWDENDVHLLLDEESNDEKEKKIIEYFFKTLDVKGVGVGIINKFFEAGYTTIPKIMMMEKSDFLELEKVKDKSAANLEYAVKSIYTKIKISKTLSDVLTENKVPENKMFLYSPEMMAASCVFEGGFSIKRFTKILNDIPDVMFLESKQIHKKLSSIGGFNKLVDLFIAGIEKYKKFISEFPVKYRKKRLISEEKETDVLSEMFESKLAIVEQQEEKKKISKDISKIIQSVVFTGSHPKDLIALIEEYGGSVKTSVSKKTTLVVVEDMSTPASSSRKKGEENGIKILSTEEFRKIIA